MQYEKKWQVVRCLKLPYAPAGHATWRKYFDTEDEVLEYIKNLDKSVHEWIRVYKLEREYNSGYDF